MFCPVSTFKASKHLRVSTTEYALKIYFELTDKLSPVNNKLFPNV